MRVSIGNCVHIIPIVAATQVDDTFNYFLLINLGGRRYIEYEYDPELASAIRGIYAADNRQIPDVSHVLPDPDDPNNYIVHQSVTTEVNQAHQPSSSTRPIPAALVSVDFNNWSSNRVSNGRLVRGVAGILFNASKNQGCDLRTFLHLFIAGVVTSAVVVGADTLGGKWQSSLGYEKTSYTGAGVADPIKKLISSIGSTFKSFLGYAMSAFKDALAMQARNASSRGERLKIALLVAGIEFAINQFFANFISATILASTGTSPIEKAYLDNLLNQVFISGLVGGGIQGLSLFLGAHPAVAYILYQVVRGSVYRVSCAYLQLTTHAAFIMEPHLQEQETAWQMMNNATNSTLTLGEYLSFCTNNDPMPTSSSNTSSSSDSSTTTPPISTGNNTTQPISTDSTTGATIDCSVRPMVLQAAIIAQFAVEIGLAFIGASSYLTGAFKLRDGDEEQLLRYAEQQGVRLPITTRVRLGLSRSIDSLSQRWARLCCRPCIASVIGMSDEAFVENLQRVREQGVNGDDQENSSPEPPENQNLLATGLQDRNIIPAEGAESIELLVLRNMELDEDDDIEELDADSFNDTFEFN